MPAQISLPLAWAKPAPLPRVAILVPAAVLAAVAFGLYVAIFLNAFPNQQDLGAYLAGGRALLQGKPLYSAFLHHPFPDPLLRPAYIYPPFFAILMAPLALLPSPASAVLWGLLMQACLLAAFVTFIRQVRIGPPLVLIALAISLTFYPLQVDLIEGQVNPALLLLLVLAVTGVAASSSLSAAAAGFAAALKITPLLTLIWLTRERRLMALLAAILGTVVPTLLGALLRPNDTVAFFGTVLPELGHGTAYYSNQSLDGVLMRLFTTNPYTHPLFALGPELLLWLGIGIGLFVYWFAVSTRLDLFARAISFLPLMPLLSVVSWEHHLVILLPCVWLALVRLRQSGWPLIQTVAFGFLVTGFSVLPRLHPATAPEQLAFYASQTHDLAVFLAANGLVLCTLALFLISPWLLRVRS